ncbi:MAG TPA: hypothetical protein VEC97_02920 [Candidatus Acidoferrales bacterium]|nr:hypothetical protein [Candidatus Acidoferrales bacterium]
MGKDLAESFERRKEKAEKKAAMLLLQQIQPLSEKGAGEMLKWLA